MRGGIELQRRTRRFCNLHASDLLKAIEEVTCGERVSRHKQSDRGSMYPTTNEDRGIVGDL